MAPIQERTHFPVRGRSDSRNHHFIFTYTSGERVAIAGPGTKAEMNRKLPLKKRIHPDAKIDELDVGDGYSIKYSGSNPYSASRLHQHDSDGNAR